MADQRYTPVSNQIWAWFLKRWKPLADDAEVKLLWLFFYTSSEAKASVPGLWPGSIYAMVKSGLSPNTAHNALDRMVRHQMAQYDHENELVRLTELPDSLDRAHTEQAIHGWFTRFKTLPVCPLRDSHIPTLWELVRAGKTNIKMEDAWKATFGTIVTPTHLPSFLPLSSSDTSTPTQTSLFASPPKASASDFPPPFSRPNEINHSGPRSLPTDQGKDQGSGSGDPDQSGAAIETAIRPRPALALVLPFTPESLLVEIATGMGSTTRPAVRETLRDALRATIRALDERGWGATEARLAGRWLASNHGRPMLEALRARQQPGSTNCPPDEVLCVWAASTSDVVSTIQDARERERIGAERSAFLAELTGTGAA